MDFKRLCSASTNVSIWKLLQIMSGGDAFYRPFLQWQAGFADADLANLRVQEWREDFGERSWLRTTPRFDEPFSTLPDLHARQSDSPEVVDRTAIFTIVKVIKHYVCYLTAQERPTP